MPKEITVTINPDGTTKTDLSGYQGPACLDVAEQLRQLLASRFGVKLQQISFTPKPELTPSEPQSSPVKERDASHE